MDDNEFKRKVLENNEKMITLMETMTAILGSLHINYHITNAHGMNLDRAFNNLKDRIESFRSPEIKKDIGLKY